MIQLEVTRVIEIPGIQDAYARETGNIVAIHIVAHVGLRRSATRESLDKEGLLSRLCWTAEKGQEQKKNNPLLKIEWKRSNIQNETRR